MSLGSWVYKDSYISSQSDSWCDQSSNHYNKAMLCDKNFSLKKKTNVFYNWRT